MGELRGRDRRAATEGGRKSILGGGGFGGGGGSGGEGEICWRGFELGLRKAI